MFDILRVGGGGIAGDMLRAVCVGAVKLLLLCVPKVRSGDGETTVLCMLGRVWVCGEDNDDRTLATGVDARGDCVKLN